MVSKKIKKRSRFISWFLAVVTAYILLVNNSLEFLKNFGINVQENVIGVIMIFITLAYGVWKASVGEI